MTPRVVVSAGTDIHPFERLMGWVETWIAQDPQRATVWVQHGTSRLPQGAEGAELTSQEEMRRLNRWVQVDTADDKAFSTFVTAHKG